MHSHRNKSRMASWTRGGPTRPNCHFVQLQGDGKRTDKTEKGEGTSIGEHLCQHDLLYLLSILEAELQVSNLNHSHETESHQRFRFMSVWFRMNRDHEHTQMLSHTKPVRKLSKSVLAHATTSNPRVHSILFITPGQR